MSPAAFFRGSSLVLSALTLLSACVSRSENIPPQTTVDERVLPPVIEETYFIGDYQGRDSGGTVPVWVNRYLEGGIAALESMDEFGGSYVFVAEISGVNIKALNQWSLGFSPEQDISRLIARRVQARFPGSDTGSPDLEYGRYFESLVRAVADTFYRGTEKWDSFWFEKKYPGASGAAPDNPQNEETAVFLILMTIDRNTLISQLEPVLAGVAEGVEASGEQLAAINRLRASFFEGF
ncbi:MAG: hypothetical protein LBF77_04830 [Spirochaetaceae bacterium]|jgi:hypothetical protein|nr:hypothetical protein [Spirochaetaceae bacterium]